MSQYRPLTVGQFWVVPSTGGINDSFARAIASTDLPIVPNVAGTVTNANLTIDQYGRVTAAANGSGGSTYTATSPINISGTVISILNTSANTFLAGPTSGGNGPVTERPIVGADVSGISLSTFTAPTGDLSIGSHKLINVTDPAAAQDAATKNYVDNAVAAIDSKADCAAATTTTLAASTYNNGSSGQGATITLTVAAVLVLDGYTPILNDRLLIKNQSDQTTNGIYILSTVGVLGVTQAVLTRSTDFDQPADVDGAIVAIVNGTTNGATRWQCLVSGTVVFGMTNIIWSTFTGQTYLADEITIHLSGPIFSINANYSGQATINTVGSLTAGSLGTGFTVVNPAQGGTGSASLTAHGVILGNGTGAVTSATIGTVGRILIDQGAGADPSFQNVSGGATMNGTGFVTINFSTSYIDGCLPTYGNITQVKIGTGTYYSPNDGGLITISSPLIYNTSSPANSTIYYLYGGNGGGSLVNSSTAPTSNYRGTAWQDAQGRRYLGSYQTDATGNIVNFLSDGYFYSFSANTTAPPLRILTTGNATVAANLDCSQVVPKTSQFAEINGLNFGTATVRFGSSNSVTPSSTLGTQLMGPSNGTIGLPMVWKALLNTSQVFQYCYNGAGGILYIDVLGFYENR